MRRGNRFRAGFTLINKTDAASQRSFKRHRVIKSSARIIQSALHTQSEDSYRFDMYANRNSMITRFILTDSEMSLSAQCDIEHHHQREADGKADRTDIGFIVTCRFGDKFFDDDVNHRAGGERQKIRQCTYNNLG